jgi:hypothetical protein
MAGAPDGNTNSSKNNRLWAETIRRAVVQSDAERLRRIAEALLTKAEEGDLGAIKELGDRLDGKSAQAVMLSGDSENPLQLIQRVIVNANDTNA